MREFNIPVAVFMFKRAEKTAMIIDQIACIAPKKIYLIGDGPRNIDEASEVLKCRELVEKHITWDCEIIRNYALENRGVYQNIAGGAQWVFEREKEAIFLEDDNYPALSFFQYCKELLECYRDDTRVLWICGTNYMQNYIPEAGGDYVFTKLMLPCGWASWANKFNKYYDGHMQLYRDSYIKENIKNAYSNKLLYKHDYTSWKQIIRDIDNGKEPISWDYQMAFSLRVNDLYGIAPKVNLIRNIGADMNSIHGGVSMDNIMTARFCEVPISELEFPLKHPKALMIDSGFEKQTEALIILPLKYRIRGTLVKIAKKILGIKEEESLSKKLKFRK